MKQYVFILTIFSICTLFSSCDPDEKVPAYLYVQPFTLTTDQGTQGTDSEKITDGWVFVGGEFLGVYTLPASLPTVSLGDQEVRIFPGIKRNGISASPGIYSFYKSYIETINFIELETDTVYPTTTYSDNTQFIYLEDFDVSHTFSDSDGDPGTDIDIITGTEAFQDGSAKITLTTSSPEFEAESDPTAKFTGLPRDRSPVFIEMNYRADINFGIGMLGYDQVNPAIPSTALILTANFEEGWNKVYFDITNPVIELGSGITSYTIVLFAQLPKDNNGEYTQETGTIYIDNMKLVHF